MRNFQNVRPLDCRIIDIVRAHRRPVPPEICGPMSEAIKWLAGKWNMPMPGYWIMYGEDDGQHFAEWVWQKGSD